MESCLYEGFVRHVRYEPVRHAFRYRLAFLYLDLAELPTVFAGSRLFANEASAPASFRRADHFGDPAVPLDVAVRELVSERCGRRPDGPIRLLTLPRVLGHAFNPISLYFCFERGGTELAVVVAEVTNTPWRERHCYVLPVTRPARADSVLRFRSDKVLHVSPFLAMDFEYLWRIGLPGEKLAVSIANVRDGRRVFAASLALERRALDPAGLRRGLTRQLLVPARVLAAIHWQALRLALRGAPFHAHPATDSSDSGVDARAALARAGGVGAAGPAQAVAGEDPVRAVEESAQQRPAGRRDEPAQADRRVQAAEDLDAFDQRAVG